ncbi:ATPase family associated with various cellular activities (AAA) [Nakamurella panacisegetis]|uniref:ATPase family associated with various cellular activities (AAA) n=1 Tax=Nakamurella panacisegetis TaxID=1090615 RepID=A0A1H0T8G6_9ACTN|nr:ATP-binding protein [Nakamurella panacisegetis]SDP49990.1 ATPase family associated with various cellular activities (AAA) [Nakamurella panacisegetis]
MLDDRSAVVAQPAGVAHLLARARRLETEVRRLIEHRRRNDPAPDDPFRGLYLSEAAIEHVLSEPDPVPPADRDGLRVVEAAADEDERVGGPSRLRLLARRAELTELDVELLLVALVPDLDSRFEKLYAYLNDDVTRRRATIGLALELLRIPATDGAARARLHAAAPLVRTGLLTIEEPDRPFLSRGLRIPDRVTAHLLGDDTPDEQLLELLTERRPLDGPLVGALADCLLAGEPLVYVRESAPGTGTGLVVAAATRAGRPLIGLDLTRWPPYPPTADLVTVVAREAALTGGLVLAHPIEALAAVPGALQRLSAIGLPLALVGSVHWDPSWSSLVPLIVPAGQMSAGTRTGLWRHALARTDDDGALAAWTESASGAQLVLGPDQIDRAVSAATALARFQRTPLDAGLLRRGAMAQNAAGLERLARRIEPAVGWPDLVLPPATIGQLQEVSIRARNRDRVLAHWRMRPGGGRGRGVLALFAGDSGTGKTMAAEVIAADLGLDLYTVNLATVVDKYVGETEKNLERIFAEAGGVNAVLLFDEADAVFGKRSEVRDAHDRYANIESAYLLQRMESFDGLAILSTNLRSNIDEAFTRRLDSVIDFPAPDEAARAALWHRCLAPPLPCAPDLDLDFCARSFSLSGGNIRSAAITAAYLAAGAGRPVQMSDLVSAIAQEYRKLGRLVLDREFAPYTARSTAR